MATSPPSGSEEARASTAFERLHPRVRRWVWEQHWRELRDAQEAAIPLVLDRHRDVLIAAATASGKTEAAFLPICSGLLDDPPEPGFAAVYVSPLKALINDQHGRLEQMCEALDIPVHRWHGDVAASRKRKALDHPAGLLLITPESLEALFVVHGPRTRTLFAATRHIVIDELHSFIGTPRGAQLRSLLHRLEYAARRRIPRVGLSATLGDMSDAAEFLRPGGGAQIAQVISQDDAQELRLQLRGYHATAPTQRLQVNAVDLAGGPSDPDHAVGGDKHAIADHLFTALRGHDNLVFVDNRTGVEIYADLLARRSALERVPNEFVPHHGSLSKEIREHVESRLKDPGAPTTAVCTSTLEMGIDIGTVTSVAQIGAPSSVSAIRQRLGRSGRRGEPAVLRVYVSEPEIDERTAPQDQLRAGLVQTIACVNLLLGQWYEPPHSGGLHLSTLIQQVLSLIAEHGGVTATDAYRMLCAEGPFPGITAARFGRLLRDLGAHDLLRQEADGLLLHGQQGERLVNHYSFFTAFAAADEYRLIADGRPLGTLPIAYPLLPGGLLIFGGRRWKIIDVDEQSKVVELTRSSGGRPPLFTGAGAAVHDRIRIEMRRIYEADDVPAYLDPTARSLLSEARRTYRRLNLRTTPVIDHGRDTLLIPFRGDNVMTTLAVALQSHGVDTALDGLALTLVNTPFGEATDRLAELAQTPPPNPEELSGHVANKIVDKHDDLLGDELLAAGYAARRLDVPAAWQTLQHIRAAAHAAPPTPHASAPPADASPRRRIDDLPYAIIDLETTGLDPLKHRIVEAAVIRQRADGTVEDEWSTLINPGIDPGPSTRIHGLTAADLVDAPSFAQVARQIAARISDAVVVAHNVTFDTAFLTSEFTRISAPPDDLLTLCTLALAGRFGAQTTSLRLADCASAEGITIKATHTALADARTAAALLTRYLRQAQHNGLQWLDELEATGNPPAPDWAPGKRRGGPAKRRGHQPRIDPHRLAARLPVPAFADARRTIYADLVTRAAEHGTLATAEATDLDRLAASLDLTRAARGDVHEVLRREWTRWPHACHVLDFLDVREVKSAGVPPGSTKHLR